MWLWMLWGFSTAVAVLVLSGALRGLFRMRALAYREEPRRVSAEWGPPVEVEAYPAWVAATAEHPALSGPPPSPVVELGRLQPSGSAVADGQTATQGWVVTRPPTDWAAKQVAVEIIAAVRVPSVTEFTPVPMPWVDELGTWEPWTVEAVPALILDDLLNEREVPSWLT